MKDEVDNNDYLLLEIYYLHALFRAQLQDNTTNSTSFIDDASWPGNSEKPVASITTEPTRFQIGQELQRINLRREKFSQPSAHPIPLISLRRTLRYDEVDHLRLLLVLAPKLDPRFYKLYNTAAQQLLHHPLHPGFAGLLLDHDWSQRLAGVARFGPNHPLRRFHLIDIDESTQQMQADERLLQFALGSEPDRLLLTQLAPGPYPAIPAGAFSHWLQPLKTSLQQGTDGCGKWVSLPENDPGALLLLAANSNTQEILPVDFSKIMNAVGLSDSYFATNQISTREAALHSIDMWLREALLRSALPVFNLVAEPEQLISPAAIQILAYLNSKLRIWPYSYVICSNQTIVPPSLESLSLEYVALAPFDTKMRGALWESILQAELSNASQSVPNELAGTYHYNLLASARIANRTRHRLSRQLGDDPKASLISECIAEARQHVSSLGQFLTARYSFDDVVLPDPTKQQLQELCAITGFQNKVRNNWGLGKKLIPNPIVTALFAGPSGTGKTLSAEIVAGQLGRPLLQVDLAAIVSKYIGDTEKNIDRVFQEAEESCSVLLFDEADACFGQRTQVNEAHDRYANIEISFLLQRMERFQGVAILATNLRQHLDEAFIRRLTMTVMFPFPSAQQRARLWRHLLPQELPLDRQLASDALWDVIAHRYKLSGGNIRNALIAAAYNAAMHDRRVGYADIIHGVNREYQKMGTQLPLGSDELANDDQPQNAPLPSINGSQTMASTL